MKDDAPILILCTAPDLATAERLGRGLVEAKLAACVNLLPGVRSIYTWKGAVEDAEEVQLLVKTTARRFEALEGFVREHHPYEVPELVVLPIEGGGASYLAWLRESTEG